VYGIGRGAGNLNTELIAKYLNEKKGKGYRIQPLLDIYDDLINHIRTEHAWGYTAPFFLSALHHANPQYGNFFGEKHEISSRDVNDIMSSFSDVEKLMF
jgi:4-hydroxy 2-oxovalerate aldolase